MCYGIGSFVRWSSLFKLLISGFDKDPEAMYVEEVSQKLATFVIETDDTGEEAEMFWNSLWQKKKIELFLSRYKYF